MKAISARKVPIIGGTIIAAIGLAPVASVKSLTVCIALLTLGYFATSLAPGVVWTVVTDVAPKETVGMLGAFQNFADFIGATCAPIFTGFIVDKTGSFQAAFFLAGAFCLLATIFYGFILSKPIKLEDVSVTAI